MLNGLNGDAVERKGVRYLIFKNWSGDHINIDAQDRGYKYRFSNGVVGLVNGIPNEVSVSHNSVTVSTDKFALLALSGDSKGIMRLTLGRGYLKHANQRLKSTFCDKEAFVMLSSLSKHLATPFVNQSTKILPHFIHFDKLSAGVRMT